MEIQKQIRFSLPTSTENFNELPLLFAARMLVVFLIWVSGMKHIPPPFLPFIPGMEYLKELSWFYFLLDGLYWISLVAVVTGFRFQQFALILGALVFFVILGSKPQFSNSFLYTGCLLFLVGIYRPGLEWIFRVQIALLYLGAGINKLFDQDWQSGLYFEFFLSEVYVNPLTTAILGFFDLKKLGLFLSWTTVIVELTFGLWASVGRKTFLLFIWIQFFHLSMLVLTLGELSFIFYYLMGVSSYLILPWTSINEASIRYLPDSRFSNILKSPVRGKDFSWEEIKEKDDRSFSDKIFSLIKLIVLKSLFYGLIIGGITFLCMYSDKFSF